MSPILDLQRRHAELFRIRAGERTDKGAPRALDGKLRVTSRSPAALDAICAVYGGEPHPWAERPGEHEAVLPVDSLRVVILPGDSVTCWWESWRAKPGGMPVCQHRCDGEVDHRTGEACSCPPVAQRLADRERWCQPVTRLSVILPDVAVIGAGVLVSHGVTAAETLPQGVAVLQGALGQGQMVPATLRIVHVASSGRHYIVPRLEIVGVSLTQLIGGSSESLLLAPTRSEDPPSLPPSPVSLSKRGEGGPAPNVQGHPADCPACGGSGTRRTAAGRTIPCPGVSVA